MKTKKYVKRISIFIAILSLLSFGYIQSNNDPFIASLKALFSNYSKNVPFEKVYLHIDRPFYKPGEDIWFKAYLTNTDNTPSKKSDVVHVELINPKGTVEKSLTLQAIQGICFGNFTIDESLPGGLYKIKAYTNWMQNFGDDYFFEKDVQIQKVVYSRVLSKIDFKRESFAPGDTVKAELSLETLENIPLSFKPVDIDVSLDGSKFTSYSAVTDNKGKSMLAFRLPTNLKTADGLVNIKIQHEGNTEAISRSIPIVLNKVTLQFFPEGGYMVDNVPCRIAFKALNEFGKPADIEGFISDETGAVVTSMVSYHSGTGAFDLVPLPRKKYFATITKPSIKEKIELPEAAPKGYVLKVEKSEEGMYSAQIYSPLEEKLHLVIQSGQTLCYTKTLDVNKGLNQLEFSSAKFPVGIGRVTLFDQYGVPRCERLVFFNYNKQLNVSLHFDKKKYMPREKINLKIRTLDQDSIPIPANLSLSVVNDQLYTFADDKQHNIQSWLLVGSDIKGKIEKPDFYFKKDEPKAEKALDYLLLTQGWRRYKWDDILSGNYATPIQAQRIGCVSGTIINKTTGEPIKAEVSILELDNKKRVLKVNTAADGKFKFLDTDANVSVQLLARSEEVDASNIAILVDEINGTTLKKDGNFDLKHLQIVPEIIKERAKTNNNDLSGDRTRNRNRGNSERNEASQPATVENGMVLTADVKKLDEVVVIGYGTQKKSDVTGSITVINSYNTANLQINGVSSALQGRAAGVDITNNTGGPGSNAQIRIRGVRSLSASNDPLYVIDGVVYDETLSGSSNPLENIPLNDIKDVSILKDASASSIYGCRGAAGVIIITTNSNWGNFKNVKRPFIPRYAGLIVEPRRTSYTKEFYFPMYEAKEMPEERTDFRQTIYWNPNINTNSAGKAEVEFYASDEITSFRAIAEGIGTNGCVGRTEEKFYAQLPFSMSVKFPAYLSFNDTVIMPLIIKNNTNKTLKGSLNFRLPLSIDPISELPENIDVDANSSRTLLVPMEISNIAGKYSMSISFSSNRYKDAFSQEVVVQPKGFPTKLSFSSRNKEEKGKFTVNKSVKGSVRLEFNAFPNPLTDLLSGVESIIREPYGCFEQTSSSTYPNIMALQYMREAGINNPEVEKRALEYIDRGYKRLIGFETSENGFEWFGHTPAHEGLTAYGIMEFIDMKKVYDGVDDKMVERTRKWLLSKRDGKGGFKRVYHGYGFGASNNEVSNAYIVYALSEAGINEIETEYQAALNEALKSSDPYRMALVANAAYNFHKTKDGNQLVELLLTKTNSKSWDEMKMDPSITYSSGKSLSIEAAALHTLALLKANIINTAAVNKNVNYLISSRSYGMFGSTQGTILALKALKEYAKFVRQPAEDGTIEIQLNGQKAASVSYKKGDKGKISLTGLEKYLREGENTFSIKYLLAEHPLPYTLDGTWTSLTPATNDSCSVNLVTSLNTHVSKVGETVRLTVKLQNKTNQGLPMTMAVVGIPSGLSLQPWQLKEMQEKQRFDFYEVRQNYLVLYYRQMAPNELRELNFDLKAEIAGSYQAPASSGYLYYTNEFKKWVDGEYIKIE